MRARQQRNFLTTLLLSQGAPMLLGGDEFGRTQGGSNNAWCQDNEISWFDWESADTELIEFVKRLIRLRQEHPVFRREAFLTGREVRGSGLPDVWWFRPDGRRMTQKDWQREDAHTLGVFLNGEEIPNKTPDGKDIVDDSFLAPVQRVRRADHVHAADAPLRRALAGRDRNGQRRSRAASSPPAPR